MDWILQHLQLVIAAAGGIAWWLNQRKRSDDPAKPKPGNEGRPGDAALAERTRRIREEIQRKIEERARGEVGSRSAGQNQPMPIPPVMAPQTSREPLRPQARAAMTNDEAEQSTEMLVKQAALAEQRRQAVELKTAALRRLRSGGGIPLGEGAIQPVRAAVIDDLKDVAAFRRAIILREIIGPPVALR